MNDFNFNTRLISSLVPMWRIEFKELDIDKSKRLYRDALESKFV